MTVKQTSAENTNRSVKFIYKISNETLVDAQKPPDNYRDLLVRVSGFSACFAHLPKDVQQEVIDRNEQSFS